MILYLSQTCKKIYFFFVSKMHRAETLPQWSVFSPTAYLQPNERRRKFCVKQVDYDRNYHRNIIMKKERYSVSACQLFKLDFLSNLVRKAVSHIHIVYYFFGILKNFKEKKISYRIRGLIWKSNKRRFAWRKHYFSLFSFPTVIDSKFVMPLKIERKYSLRIT